MATERDAGRQNDPGKQYPAPGDEDPAIGAAAREQHGKGQGKGHDEPSVAGKQSRRMDDHLHVLQQGIQVPAFHCRGKEAFEGARKKENQGEKAGLHRRENAQYRRHKIRIAFPVQRDHRRRKEAEQRGPQKQRPLVTAPEGRHLKEYRQARVRVTGHIEDAKVTF